MNSRTRLTLFKFTIEGYQFKVGNWMNVSEAYHGEIYPGLSAYAKNPQKCLQGLESLLANVRHQLDEYVRKKTPLLLKLAENIMVLPEKQGEQLLKVVKEYINKTEFKIYPDSVSLLEGSYRRLTSWIAINLLLDRFTKRMLETVPMLNLESRAALVSFAPEWFDLLARWQWKNIVNITIGGQEFDVFSYSYAGLGYDEMRRQVFQMDRDPVTKKYISPCLHPQAEKRWEFKGVVFEIKGAPTNGTTPGVNLTRCAERMKKVLREHWKGPNLNEKDVYVSSHYYSTVADAGLVKKPLPLKLSLNEIRTKAKEVCSILDTIKPFLCMDLIYMNVQLRKGYHLKRDKEINAVKVLNDLHVKWTLGAAFLAYQREVNP